MSTIVTKCSCKHDFQDENYGKQMRLYNLMGDKKDDHGKCTVCGTIKKLK